MISEQLWPWVLFVFELMGITGMWFVGKRMWWGWLIVLLHSIPWLVYSLIFEQWGFVAMVAMWWTVNFTNMMKWRNNK